ncbi:hypothetical protein QF028_002417 [Neobacillus sp. B4I6]|uniref:hypothetical protein n=1 Tax=Bacillaceae TaxID=186817 RepID=UPI000A2AAF08|nr:hypothetical protein [Bacillus sp. OV166]SMQ87055.1 hypothetical protein SAMN05444673_7157 [Bacillus sp. OV166]
MSFYDKMFSTFGYMALELIFGVDEASLKEEEKRQLIHLSIMLEKNAALGSKVSEIMNSNLENEEKLALFFKLKNSVGIE